MNRYLDKQKAIEALLFVIPQIPKANKYATLKVLYFADKLHLERYGTQIYGDTFIAMEHGPVPSYAYDLAKSTDQTLPVGQKDERTLVARRPPNTDYLSQADIECLEEAIRAYGHLPFGKLKQLSHDAAFTAAERNSAIPFIDLVKSLPNSQDLLEHLQS